PAPQTAEEKRLAYERIKAEEVKNNDKGLGGFFKQFGQNFLRGIGQTAQSNPNANLYQLLGGGLGRGTVGSVDNTLDERTYKQQREAQALQDYQVAQKMDENNLDLNSRNAEIASKNAQTEYTKTKPELDQQKLDVKQNEMFVRDQQHRARVVASIYNKMQDFDPSDPENTDIVEQMEFLGLPVFKKEANQQIKYVQDEESGEMFVLSTDKQTGETQAAQIVSNGSPLKLTTKTAVGVRVKDLDRTSREKIATARNRTTIDAAKIGAGSRLEVAKINQQGANSRNEADNQVKIQLGEKTKGMTANQLLPKLTDYAKKNFMTIEQAKEAFRGAGINVDEILQR
ncbi:MAG: hypothetical protein LC778_07705, partial [Acidobacteria bacterium]|nr:hypothetical protein [Acidobacteriota bacterium]